LPSLKFGALGGSRHWATRQQELGGSTAAPTGQQPAGILFFFRFAF